MEKKLYKEFLSLFWFLPEAGSIISEDNAYHDELRLKLISGMQQFTEKILLSHLPNESLFDEIKENLIISTIDKKAFLSCILSDFKDISAYLNIRADKEYCSFYGHPALKIGDIYYSEYHISTHKLLERHCHWIKPVLEYDKTTIPEKYIIQCHHAYNTFFRCLDELCLLFQINLTTVQKELGLQIFERSISNQPQDLKNPELTIKQIALIYIYKGDNITRETGKLIAKEFGFNSKNSGDKLYQYFNKYYRLSDRTGAEDTELKTKNKIALIENVIELLPEDKQIKARDELSILKISLKEFQ